MKILVCFKIVKDCDYVLKNDWNDVANNAMDWSYVKSIFSCYDEGAIENALRLKDSYAASGETAHITAVTICENNCDMFNSHLLASGVDKVVNLTTDNCSHFSPYKNASIIANFIKDDNYDIIITGYENACGNNAVFPYALGELLHLDVLNNVSSMYYDKKVIAEVETNTEKIKYEAKQAIYSFKNTEHSCLRFPSLMDRLSAKNKPTIKLNAKDYITDDNLDLQIDKMYVLSDEKVVKMVNNLDELCSFIKKEVANE